MDEIFLITFNDGDYESHDSPVGYVVSEDIAQTEVEYRNNIQKEAIEYGEILLDYKHDLEKTFTPPEYEKMLDVPRWKAGLSQDEITDKMKSERTLIRLKNEQASKRNDVKREDYNKKINLFLETFKDTVEISADAKSLYDELGNRYYALNKNGYSYRKIKKIA